MPLSYEVRFLFTSPRGALTEIKRLDLPANAAKDRVYHWLWISERAVTTLQFVGMRTEPRQVRTFREAELSFDRDGAQLRWRDGQTLALKAAAGAMLDADQQRLVHNHLS